jgi:predicted permease
MNNFVQVVFFLLVGLTLGTLSRRRPGTGIPENLAEGLTTFVIFVSLPALILVRVPPMHLSGDLLVPAVLPWTMVCLSAAVVLLAARLLRWDDGIRNLLLLLVPLGNTSFLGIPMVQAFFGEGHVSYALLYDQLGSFPALATYGTLIVSLHSRGGTESGPVPRQVVLRMISFPPFIALLVALASRSFAFHPAIVSSLEALSNTLVPLVMVAVGLRLRFGIPLSHRAPLAAGLTMKLVLAPLLALGICRLLGFEGDAVDVSIFEAGMPPMVAAWALASRAGLYPDLGAALVGLGILFSFLTLPLLRLLL